MNFVISCTKRAGGNLVMDFLSHQKNLHCHGSIFPSNDIVILRNPENLTDIEIDFNKLMESQKWPGAVRRLKEAQNLTNLFLREKNRYENVVQILKILEKSDKKNKVGFKFSLEDYEKMPPVPRMKLFKLLGKNGTKLIFLDRRNQFEQYVSVQLCNKYKKYIRKSAELPKLQKIGIKPTEYLMFKETENSLRDRFINDLVKFNVKFREYHYEDLNDETTYIDTYKSMLEFLEEKPEDFIDATSLLTHKKVNIYPPNISVSNYESVYHFLKTRNDINFV